MSLNTIIIPALQAELTPEQASCYSVQLHMEQVCYCKIRYFFLCQFIQCHSVIAIVEDI